MFDYLVYENLCKEKGETTYQVCKETGVQSATIANWKKHSETDGKSGYVPKADKILLIAKHFGVPLENFIVQD